MSDYLTRVAHHESGHALVAWRIGCPLAYVTAGRDGGFCMPTGASFQVPLGLDGARMVLAVWVAGAVAEEMLTGDGVLPVLSESDQRGVDGWLARVIPFERRPVVFAEALDLAAGTIDAHRSVWVRLAGVLVERGRVDGADAVRVLAG